MATKHSNSHSKEHPTKGMAQPETALTGLVGELCTEQAMKDTPKDSVGWCEPVRQYRSFASLVLLVVALVQDLFANLRYFLLTSPDYRS